MIDAMRDDASRHAVTSYTQTTSYVSAPIVSGDRFIGTLNADLFFSNRLLDETDRDNVATAASALGVRLAHVWADQRAVRMRNELSRLLEESDSDADVASTQRSMQTEPNPRTASKEKLFQSLTPRERVVLSLLARGGANAQIARELVVSEETVKTHLKHVYRKLGVANRAEAVACWYHE